MKRQKKKSSITFNFTGSVAVVSGGGRGIGRAVCVKFLAAGAQVVCLDIDESFARGLSRKIFFQKVDVTKTEECKRAIEETVRRFGGVDVLVNSAVIQPPSSFTPAHLFPEELWNKMVAVNVS